MDSKHTVYSEVDGSMDLNRTHIHQAKFVGAKDLDLYGHSPPPRSLPCHLTPASSNNALDISPFYTRYDHFKGVTLYWRICSKKPPNVTRMQYRTTRVTLSRLVRLAVESRSAGFLLLSWTRMYAAYDLSWDATLQIRNLYYFEKSWGTYTHLYKPGRVVDLDL